MRIKSLSLTTVFLSWHSVCHKLHALYGQRPAVAKPNGLLPFFDVVSTHRTWYMVHTISLYALLFSATRNYYIDYRANVDKIAIKATMPLLLPIQTPVHFSSVPSLSLSPTSGLPKPSGSNLVQLLSPAPRSLNGGPSISVTFF